MGKPISDDTAALVAAQLTVAWAALKGPTGGDQATLALQQYIKFRSVTGETTLRRPG